jgi:hypothetical protein
MELNETTWADEYADELLCDYIRTAYRARWHPKTNPATHPHLYDPFLPPEGWRYDPYCECWVAL